jgi:hypothetical protein
MAVPLSFPAQEIQVASSQGGIALAHYCHQLFQAAREYRRPLVNTWQQNYLNLHVRDYWKNRNPQYPTPRLPEMWPIIAAMVGWMTDTRPGFEVAPVAEPFTPFKAYYDQLAQDLQNVLTANWIINDHDREIETMLWDANVYGTGILKVLWDPLKVGGLGDAVMRRVDPFTFYVDPNATKMENANFFVDAGVGPHVPWEARSGDDEHVRACGRHPEQDREHRAGAGAPVELGRDQWAGRSVRDERE